MRRPVHRFVVVTLGGAAALLIAVCALTYGIDPYAVHGVSRIEGVNAKKPFAYTHAAWAKRRLARATRPRSLFLGNSRVDVGFDPLSPALNGELRPAFNFGIPGQALSRDYGNVISTRGLDDVTWVLIGLDYPDFTYAGGAGSPTRPGPDAGPGIADLVRINLSSDALVHSVLTVVSQESRFTNSMTLRGRNTFAEHAGHVRLEGHSGLFHQRNIEHVRAYSKRARQVQAPDGGMSPSFRYLDWLLEWCRARGATVDLVIYPYHAQLLEVLHHTGHWPAYERWKRLLVQRVDGEAGRVRLWDFSGYHEAASEQVPPKGDTRTLMRWYWEAGHFKSALGDVIVSRILGAVGELDIGVRLTRENVEEVIEEVRAGRDRWRAAHPDEARYVEKLHADFARR